jgi:hypothetical protein
MTERVCVDCSTPVTYKGVGRVPKYCDEHRRVRAPKPRRSKDDYDCAACGDTFRYSGVGAIPKYCDEHRRAQVGVNEPGRVCVDCKTWKPGEDFYKAASGGFWPYCKVCSKVRNRAQYERRREDPEWVAANLEAIRREKMGIKVTVIEGYGGKCACCGEAEPMFLTLDHVNNDGAEHRRTTGLKTGMTTWRYAKREGFPDIFQLLCWNCNSSKGAYGFCPHEKS